MLILALALLEDGCGGGGGNEIARSPLAEEETTLYKMEEEDPGVSRGTRQSRLDRGQPDPVSMTSS